MTMVCLRCGANGHLAKECSQLPACNNCGGKGHLAKNCPSTRCDRCGRPGHLARECTRGGGSVRCYECGENGHMSRECPAKEKKQNSRPVDPFVRQKHQDTAAFHQARGRLLNAANIAATQHSLQQRLPPLRSKRVAPALGQEPVDDSAKRTKHVAAAGPLRLLAVKPKASGCEGGISETEGALAALATYGSDSD